MTRSVFCSSEDLPLCYEPSKHRRLRVADILLQDEDENGDFGFAGKVAASMDGDKGCVGSVEYSSLRRIIVRWLKRLREKKGVKGKERVENMGGGLVPTRCSTNGLTGGAAVSSGFEESNDGSGPSGSCRTETSFNLGVGFSLLYLLARSKNELDKMMELRTQMEHFLQFANKELQREYALSRLSEPDHNVACLTNDVPQGSNSNSNRSHPFSSISYAIPESETILESDHSSQLGSPKHEYSAEGMNQLGEELEAELERLQLHMNTETELEHPQLQRIKVAVKDTVPVIEDHSMNFGEVIDPQEVGSEEYYDGVPPRVLERRLHELLEARQQEHIEELESALACLQRKVQEKQMEISWWKDTAKLLSQHIPGTSQHGPETSCYLR